MMLIKITDTREVFFGKIKDRQAIFFVLTEKARSFISEDKPHFLNKVKKLLIQYYIPKSENTRRLKIFS